MRILSTELRLRVKNRKPRPFMRAASADATVGDSRCSVNQAFDDADGGGAGGSFSRDSAISSPSTPNSSLSSQSNLVCGGGTPSPNTPSPATPTSQQSANTPLSGNSAIYQTPGSGFGVSPSGHKNSLKGTKLARRARSFKDDLIEKISMIRTPNNTLGRSHSPHSPRSKPMKPPPTAEEVAKSASSLEMHVKDISNALKHFCDVILKSKLEVLPGNATVILETIASMYTVIQSYALDKHSTVLLSATQQVYQSLGKLVKLCDEVMLIYAARRSDDEGGEDQAQDEHQQLKALLSEENVKEIVDLLGDAVRNLATLAQQKLKEREENAFKYAPSNADAAATANNAAASHNNLMRLPVEVAGQRTSLPDITLTPKERDILEKTNSNPIRASHSTESILRDTSPPPKPPLPNRPPPLPPKRRSQQQQQQNSHNKSINSDLDWSSDISLGNYGVDYNLSVRSHSPDENSSQCSLDSELNHSREEEELKSLVLANRLNEFKPLISGGKRAALNNKVAGNKTVGTIGGGGVSSESTNTQAQSVVLEDSKRAAGTSDDVDECDFTQAGNVNSGAGGAMDKLEMRKNINNRHSNESGFVSMTSVRTSAQSVSKRSSDCGFQSSTKSSSNSEIAFDAIESSSSGEFHTQTQEFHQQTTCLSMTNTISSTMMTTSNSIMNNMSTLAHDARSISNTSSVSPDHYESGGLITERSVHTTSSASHVQSSFSSLVKANSLDTTSSSDGGMGSHSDLVPPALPPKTSRNKDARIFSQYDNFDEIEDNNSELAELRPHHHYNSNSYSQHNQHALQQHHNHHHQYQHHVSQWQQTKHQSLIDSRRLGGGFVSSCTTMGSIGVDISSSGGASGTAEQPPPLPIKKKHIWAYMELCQGPNRPLGRHTMHMYDLTGNISHSQTMNIVPLPKDLSPPSEQEMPPALPPKNYKQQRKSSATPPTIITTPPPSPKPAHLSASADAENGRPARVLSATQGSEMMSTVCEELSDLTEEEQASLRHSHQLPNENCSSHMSRRHSPLRRADTHEGTPGCRSESAGEDQLLEHSNFGDDKCGELQTVSQEELPKMLEEIDVTKYLVLKRKDEDGPEVKGGYVDALIVHASRVQNDNAFIDAFITTFRTFIQPIDVIEKLTHRYTIFFCCQNDQKQRVARETFSLLMRVVDGLTSMDLTDQLLSLIVEFNYQLVCAGQLYLAKTLRSIFVEKVTLFREQRLPPPKADMHITVTNQPSLLDLKSVEIAEQMTLLDADLFQKIEIPEVLLFAKEQSEEKSPNLNKFTEHFNNMSFWARSKILTLCDAKEREKHVIKFIKIMKHLRKMNNYNSYLALLSALDSAPIRRLEWHKTITQDIKEYCLLIDSSSSFRAYRTTLAATSPPCIPYIGLVLQDLTFVHVGNPDYLKEGVVNFSKRWQQYHLIENMKRFKKCEYNFKRNERIIRFFDNFEYELGEEEMWQISESIKPRGRRPVQA
ncbi:guanine nucleotide-releasing factor 2 isoform X2 [Anastrepha obliqua]|uniref:guanine nucleotide-releasing factor 2 isoform X2 n=1 Tax=Anastrepha obliqua TaxID=95512 RepID=UPI00240910F3|nr:guanine nucleotide-releasing factor 2 isoform X2 [Anastrepha obliqua]XP_054728045.1 guanine nucleotide-releasing factor 2 isoform X2 [Anastrepha obliqua]